VDLRDAAAYHALVLNAEGASLSTQRNYLFYWSKLIQFCEETGYSNRVEQFSPDLVRRASVWYRSHASGRRDGAVAVRQFVARMNTIGALLIREKILRKSAYQSLKLPRVAKLLREPYTQTEVAAMWGVCHNTRNPERDGALLLMLLDTGMRPGEACGLTLDKVHLDEHQLIVGETGKGKRERIVPFGDLSQRSGGRAVQALKTYLAVRPGTAFDRGRVFLDSTGHPILSAAISDAIQRVGEQAGVPNPIPYRLRHTFCTWYLVQYPGDELGLRRIVGHLSKEVLADYVHFAQSIVAERAGRASLAEQWLGGSPVTPRNVRSFRSTLANAQPRVRGRRSIRIR
jgi:integrase/recombinase XerD